MITSMRGGPARFAAFAVVCSVLVTGGLLIAQTREKGPWWPSPHGAQDQAGASNLITPEKVLKALRIPKNGQTYELGHIYGASMPQYSSRAFAEVDDLLLARLAEKDALRMRRMTLGSVAERRTVGPMRFWSF